MGGCPRTWWTLLGLSSVVSKIDLVNFLTAKVHIHQTIFFGRSKRDLMAYQGFANLVKRVAKGTLPFLSYFSNDIISAVDILWKGYSKPKPETWTNAPS